MAVTSSVLLIAENNGTAAVAAAVLEGEVAWRRVVTGGNLSVK